MNVMFYFPTKPSIQTVRRVCALTSVFVLLCLTGCSQNGDQEFSGKDRIPIDPKRWYQLNNTTKGLDALFNGKTHENISVGDGKLLANYDSYYPLSDGEQMTVRQIRFFDWEGTNEDHPMTLYAVLKDWRKVKLATFTGTKYDQWVGPDPQNTGKFKLDMPVSGIRYLLINSWGALPAEMEVYGDYTAPKPLTVAAAKPAPLQNYFGVNAFEWDLEAPENPAVPDPGRAAVLANFTGIRHYMDWDKLEGKEGTYAFAPTYNGSWNYDAMYQWCKDHNIEVLACLKTVPGWMLADYPKDEQDNEIVPMRHGRNASDPRSYIEQAKVAFQYAARYGSNKQVNAGLLKLKDDNKPRSGLGLIQYIECDNERDKWWKGRKAYQTGREYAANLSAFYDGHKNTMGPGAGVKNADPKMQVVMAGLAAPKTDYVIGMIDWCKENRGYKSDGSVDCPWDVINYHFYANDASRDAANRQTTGVAPELARADSFAKAFVQLSHEYLHDMPVWVTETGYDINPESPQKAPAMHGKDALQTQADWVLRTSLLYARTGIQRVFFYELYDDNPGNGTKYATSGIVNKDRTSRIAADYIRQTNKRFGRYTYKETLSKDPIVDHYTLGSQDMYMLVVPDEQGRTANYKLDLGKAGAAYLYKPKGGNDMDMQQTGTTNGKVNITVTETPVFVTTEK